VVNFPVNGDLNFRFFEALSSGALLLTKRLVNGQEKLFTEDLHYVAFDDEKELFAKVEFFLQHDSERQRIAACGHGEVMRHHVLADRLQTLLAIASAAPTLRAPIRTLQSRDVQDLYSAVYERAGRVEALLRMAAEERERNMRWQYLAFAAKAFLRKSIVGC
jgi:hypothetical protein